MKGGTSSAARPVQTSAPAKDTKLNALKSVGVASTGIARATHDGERNGIAAKAALPLLQLVVGTLVTASAIVGYTLHPSVAAVAALMGAGLIIAGAMGLVRTVTQSRGSCPVDASRRARL